MLLSEAVKKRRKELGMTQKEVAKKSLHRSCDSQCF